MTFDMAFIGINLIQLLGYLLCALKVSLYDTFKGVFLALYELLLY